jgi:hypothetical protein
MEYSLNSMHKKICVLSIFFSWLSGNGGPYKNVILFGRMFLGIRMMPRWMKLVKSMVFWPVIMSHLCGKIYCRLRWLSKRIVSKKERKKIKKKAMVVTSLWHGMWVGAHPLKEGFPRLFLRKRVVVFLRLVDGPSTVGSRTLSGGKNSLCGRSLEICLVIFWPQFNF